MPVVSALAIASKHAHVLAAEIESSSFCPSLFPSLPRSILSNLDILVRSIPIIFSQSTAQTKKQNQTRLVYVHSCTPKVLNDGYYAVLVLGLSN